MRFLAVVPMILSQLSGACRLKEYAYALNNVGNTAYKI